MALQTRKGPHGKQVLVFTPEDLPQINFSPQGSAMGFVFIDNEGEVHFELNNLRILGGNLLEMIFRPRRFNQELGSIISGFSLLKEKERLLGGIRFLINKDHTEIRLAGTGLLPWSEVPPTYYSARKVAFGRLMEAIDQFARKFGAKKGIEATDGIPPEKLARFGWEPYEPVGLERLKISFSNLPFRAKRTFVRYWS